MGTMIYYVALAFKRSEDGDEALAGIGKPYNVGHSPISRLTCSNTQTLA
jgi:hypothetical protein